MNAVAIKGRQHSQGKIVIESKVIEQIKEFDCFGCSVSRIDVNDVYNNPQRCQCRPVCGRVRHTQ